MDGSQINLTNRNDRQQEAVKEKHSKSVSKVFEVNQDHDNE